MQGFLIQNESKHVYHLTSYIIYADLHYWLSFQFLKVTEEQQIHVFAFDKVLVKTTSVGMLSLKFEEMLFILVSILLTEK